MATLPAEGRWSLRLLSDDDFKGALEFLQRDPLINVYLISRLIEERTLAATQIAVVRYNGAIVLVASLATNIVLAGDPSISNDITDCAVALIAERILTRMLPVRAIISPATLVESLWNLIRLRIDPPTVVRMNQPIYAIRKRVDYPDLDTARYSTLRDLEQLVPACAAMHREEVGIDPMDRDAFGYRERIRELVEKKRSVIRTMDGLIASKCEYSAVTPDTVQLMGVWTDPRYRRRGLSQDLIREVCGHLFHKGKTVTLFVNDFNRPAIALYESLGFQQIGMNRALIW
ncbi:MAG TPA: GNAT family N-acetyltransferase [Thermoanaerobaculia bacterium]|jgi:predicted GNAT family acetyltransferase|nr:GNAT family N-acetyltransferase [Thermoanaerobaculia bacterium]